MGSLLARRIDSYFFMERNDHKKLCKLIGQLIQEIVYSGSSPSEAYSIKLIDDPAFNDESIYVPDKTKLKLKAWLKSMKLD